MFDFGLTDDADGTLKKCGIYKITCTANQKFYVGSTTQSFRTRVTRHRNTLRDKQHHSKYFQNCFDKYSESQFIVEILEVVDRDQPDLKNHILDREQFYIDTLKPELNMYPSARSCLGVKRDEDFCNKIRDSAISRMTSNTGESNIYWYKERFIVDVRHKRVGSFTVLADAVVARDHYLKTKETYVRPTKSNEPYITSQDSGWKVLVKGKYIGFFEDLPDAIVARDAFLALPIEQQIVKVCQSNTGEKNIQYRKKNNRYRVIFADYEISSSCKTLEEAIQVRDNFLATGEKPKKRETNTGHKYIRLFKGDFIFMYKRKILSKHTTLSDAIEFRNNYFTNQNKLESCGLISGSTSVSTSTADTGGYDKSSSDTHSS